MDDRPIGMFDSGIGGMTVYKEIARQLPNEKVIYLGDTKRFPYGAKSRETIIELTKKGVEFLIQKGVKEIVIACGTATSQALEIVKSQYDIPIIGIIEPTIQYIQKQSNIKKIGVIATAGTIRSKGWEQNIKKVRQDITIVNRACPLLAPMAEEGWTDNEIAKLTVKEYLKGLEDVDSLILGCTHYPLFKNFMKQELKANANLIDTGEMVANYLKETIVPTSQKEEKQLEVYLTDTESNFIEVAHKLLGYPIKGVKKAEI